MILKKLRIRNFRCYQEEMCLDFEDIIALVGKNDAGKSTIMDALDIFLNDSKPDKDDASKNGNSHDLTIICEFEVSDDKIIIDDSIPTTLKEEHLLNKDNRLEIHKTYNGSLQTPKCTNISAYAMHPTINKANDLIQLKRPQLKVRAKELGIDLSQVDQNINKDIRNAIRLHFPNLDIKEKLIPLFEDNGKKVWEALKSYLPIFALFKSDRQSTDQDPEAQDPLKHAVKEAIVKKENELNQIFEFVEKEVKKIADDTLRKLNEMDSSLASELNPQFSKPQWHNLFKASITGDENIPINKRGSGVKRLILLNFFRAKAENNALESKNANVIYGIEEPETSQHPNNQRLLLRALTELSVNNQVIISTHTPILARGLADTSLRYIDVKKNDSREILRGSIENNKIFAKSLGVLPDNNIKLFIGVEGKHDIAFLHNISKILSENGVDVPNLEQLEIEGKLLFFPLGGSSLALWTSRLCPLNRPEFHIFDRDTQPPENPKYQKEIDEINSRPNCRALCTSKKELENYIHKSAIEQTYADIDIDIHIPHNYSSFDDVPLIIAKLVHGLSESTIVWDDLTENKKEKKESKVKTKLNHLATKHMTISMLKDIDPDDEIISWFNHIKQIVEG